MDSDVAYPIEHVRAAIKEALGEQQLHSLTFLGEGMDNVAYLANGKYVFRFPKDDEMAILVEAEAAVLKVVSESVDLRIPEPCFFGRIAPRNNFFYAYPLIEGVWLSDLDEAALPPAEHQNIANSLGNFIRQLQSISLDHPALRALAVGKGDTKAEYTGDWEKLEKLIFPLVSAELRSFLTQLWHDYLNNPANFDYQPTLLHGDLAADHILVDPLTKQVSGIIDFGDVMIGDPVYELH